MNKNQVIKVPKDTVLDGVIVDIEKTTWANIIDPEKLSKFDEPNQEILRIKYEYQYEGNVLTSNESFKYYEKPMANSKLGKFLNKYETLKVGVSIKIDIDGNGFPSIRID